MAAEDKPRSGKRAWARRLGLALAGVIVGCVIVELALRLRDKGAFPHLNVYQSDERLGVRLRPGSTQKVSFGNNPVTEVRINSNGLRGPELPAPGDRDEILVVGDSQVFGLGANESEAFPARIEALSDGKWRVINAGVPTYGPLEYNQMLEELALARKPKVVVLALNVANDLFEASHPNRERHAVWDGWAVRKETAPASTTALPGRQWLMRESHAVYALRRLLYSRSEPVDPRGYASEGTFRDLVSVSQQVAAKHTGLQREKERLVRVQESELRHAEQAALAAIFRVDLIVFDKAQRYAPGFDGPTYKAGRGNPGDIIEPALGENDREIIATALQVREGVKLRGKILELLGEHARKNPEEWRDFQDALAAMRDRQKTLDQKRTEPLAELPPLSPLYPHFQKAKELADKAGSRLAVVALPLDVQVSKDEWKKYGSPGIDMEPSKVLTADALDAASRVGALTIDPTSALASAEPGVFLPTDLHLTAKGHDVVAREILAGLDKPTRALPKPGMPAGVTRPPRPWEWDTFGEIAVSRSGPAGCVTKMIRHWLYVSCRPGKDRHPTGAAITRGGDGDAYAAKWGQSTLVIAPARRGKSTEARLFWAERSHRMVLEWLADSPIPEARLEKKEEPAQGPARSSAADRICRCFKEVEKKDECDEYVGAPDADCVRTWSGDCRAMLACATYDMAFPPKCGDGQVRAGATGRCMMVCSEREPCKAGRCTDWQGAKVCALP